MESGGRFNLKAGEYEIIGVVSTPRKSISDMTGVAFRELVRRNACQIGGELISLVKTAPQSDRSSERRTLVGYFVWAKRLRFQ